MARIFVCALLVAFAALAFGQSCDNPLFAGCLGGACVGITTTTPVARTGSCADVCKTISGDTCCEPATCDSIKNIFTTYRSAIAQIYQAYRDTPIEDFNFKDIFGGANCPEAQIEAAYGVSCSDLEDIFNKIFKAYTALYKDLAEGFYSCYTAILEYFAGVICFACDPDWDNFVTDNGDGTYTFKLSTSTCSDLKDGCVPLFEAAIKFVKALAAIEEQYSDSPIGALLGTSVAGLVGEISNPCGDVSCATYVCESLVVGVTIGNPNFIGGKKRSLEIAAEHASTPYGHAADMIVNAMTLLENFSEQKRSVEALRRDLAAEVTNSYTSNGFAATQAGSKSGLETTPGEKPESTDSGNGAAAVAATAAVVAGAAAVLLV